MVKGQEIWYKPNQSDMDQQSMGIDPCVAKIAGFEPNDCLSLIIFCAHQAAPIRFLWTVPPNTNLSGFDEGTYALTESGF